LEAANGLMQRGMQVTVVNRADHLLNRQLDSQAAGFLKRELERKGIDFRLGVTIKEVIGHDGQVKKIRLNDNNLLPADILVMATGITPNIALGQQIGLDCELGIIVDDTLKTSDAHIYAVGECIQHRGEVFGLVAPVYEHAKVCARQLAGQSSAAYRSLLTATILKVTGIDLFSVGDFTGDAECQQQSLVDHSLGIYRKIVIKNDVVIGMIMYGDTSDSAWYLNLIKNQINIAAIRDNLIFHPVELAA
jgi:nitrite reductase (NADH) large subunit